MHDQWTDLMSPYLDGELEPMARRRLEAHLAECPACAGVLEDLRRIVSAAPGYQGTVPDPDPWNRIAAAIADRREVRLSDRRPGFTVRVRHLAAAAVLAAAVGAGGTWMVLSNQRAPIAGPPTITADPRATPASNVVTFPGYDAAIAQLEQTLSENRGRLDTATVRVLEQSLTSIDRAIAEARAAIQQDSSKAYLNGQIAANMRKKLNVLKLATRAIASET